MPRRNHKKSRNGCIECKRRHVKCDESHPTCVNCSTAGFNCSYALVASRRSASSTTPSNRGCPSSASPNPSNIGTDEPPSTDVPPVLHTGSYVNTMHIELFANIFEETTDTPFLDDKWKESRHHVLKYALTHDFLLYQLLAASALHLSTIHHARSKVLIDESALLQHHSLRLFNESITDINENTIVPSFLFSGTLGLRTFCENFRTQHHDLNVFLDKLIQSIKLLQGVLKIMGAWWEFLLKSDVKELMVQPDYSETTTKPDEILMAFERLRDRLSKSPNLSQSQSSIYDGVIRQLCWCYKFGCLADSTTGRRSTMVTSWPITVSVEYTELLTQRNSEALLILAYFSILLYECRHFWAVGNAGYQLLTAVELYLGPEWADELAFPKLVVHPFC